MKKLSTTKLHNFSRSTTFVLVISPFDDILKIQISNLRNLKVVLLDKMTLNEKVVNYKVAWIFEFYNFRFDCFSIRGRLKNSNFKFEKFKHTFPWQDDLKWKQSSITFLYLQLLFWSSFHVTFVKGPNMARWGWIAYLKTLQDTRAID